MKLAVVMDPIEQIKPEKDGTLDLMLSAQSFGYDLTRFHTEQLRISDGKPLGIGRSVTVSDDSNSWFTYGAENEHCLSDFDVILMRKDTPFDMEYIYSTYILDLAKMNGAKVINEPAAIRSLNEKVSITMFPNVTPPTLVTSNQNDLRSFLNDQKKIVVKPLDGMGGRSIFIVEKGEQNTNTIFEEMTRNDKKTIMAQKYIPEITDGDKRIHLVFGNHVGMSLARVPCEDVVVTAFSDQFGGSKQDFLAFIARQARLIGSSNLEGFCGMFRSACRDCGNHFIGIGIAYFDYVIGKNFFASDAHRLMPNFFNRCHFGPHSSGYRSFWN